MFNLNLIFMRKFTLLVAAALVAVSFNAKAEGVTDEQTVTLAFVDGTASHKDFDSFTTGDPEKPDNNVYTWKNGFELAITSRGDKALSGGNTIEVDGTSYKTIKVSNGATNTLFAPEGNVITKLTIYDYVNWDANKTANAGKTPRATYWREVAGTEYTEADATPLKDLISDEGYQQNPDKVEFSINNLASVTFTNTGEQPCVVLVVTYGKGETAGIVNVNAVEENAPVYNLQGVQVDENYKGIVIKNGKKYINK